MNFKNRNQLKRNVYFYIVLFFLAFLLVFLFLANLGQIAAQYNSDSELSREQRIQALFESYKSGGNSSVAESGSGVNAIATDEHSGMTLVGVLGNGPTCTMLKHHLDMLRQPWKQIDATGHFSGLIVVADGELDENKLNWLMEQNEAGAHLLFVNLPSQELIQREDILERLGIETLGDMQTYPGMRTGREMMLGAILEYDGAIDDREPMNVQAYDIRLAEQNKVFAHALTADHLERNVTDMSPLLWRHTRGEGEGYIYVCNGDTVAEETAYALLPVVLGDINGSYIYPIVNAYCVMIDGFPYAQNEDRQIWRQLYSRDGYGIQRELLLPEWERIENLYDVSLTYFSPAYTEIQNDMNAELHYYHTELRQGNGELAGKSQDAYYLYTPEDPLNVVPLTADFSFVRDGRIQLPYQQESWPEPGSNLIRTGAMARGIGYIGLRIDVASILEMQTGEELPEFFELVGTNLGYNKEFYPWLEQADAQLAVERIDTYVNLRPSYEYDERGIRVQLAEFDGEAWFILRTFGRDPEIDNGSIEKIGECTYLVSINAPYAEITWSGEEE